MMRDVAGPGGIHIINLLNGGVGASSSDNPRQRDRFMIWEADFRITGNFRNKWHLDTWGWIGMSANNTPRQIALDNIETSLPETNYPGQYRNILNRDNLTWTI